MLFLSERYETLHIDFLNFCIINTAICAYLGGIAALERNVYCLIFAVLQSVAVVNNLMIMICYVYTQGSVYETSVIMFERLNETLLVLDVISLVSICVRYRNTNT